MKKGRFTEEQIAFALKQAETGTPVAEVLRRMGGRPRNSPWRQPCRPPNEIRRLTFRPDQDPGDPQDRPGFRQALERYYGGGQDPRTLVLLTLSQPLAVNRKRFAANRKPRRTR